MKRYLKVLAWSAMSGAISAVAADAVLPLSEGRYKAVGTIAVLGAIQSAASLLKRSPLLSGDENTLPKPQDPPTK
jgi:hypothetical protein